MRKLIVLTFITLDGVMQAPGGPEEDTSGDFKFGGWSVGHFDDFVGNAMAEQMGHPFDLLLGRKTYEIFASYWPQVTDETGRSINSATKYVVSHRPVDLDWKTTVLIDGVKHDLVDEFWLKTFPVALGTGKRLFADGTMPAGFTLLESAVSPSGVVVASYARAGAVKLGSFAPST